LRKSHFFNLQINIELTLTENKFQRKKNACFELKIIWIRLILIIKSKIYIKICKIYIKIYKYRVRNLEKM